MDSGIADGTESAVWCGELDGDKVAVALLPGAEVKRDVWPDLWAEMRHINTHTHTPGEIRADGERDRCR